MRELYNEGRVIGLSPYEIYIKQLYSIDPHTLPMSEREWLTFTLNNNNSLILRLRAGLYPGPHDFTLPENSKLVGCSVIYGSMLQGEVNFKPGEYWATSVADLGQLIDNNNSRHPVTPGDPENVPTKENPKKYPMLLRKKCKEYIKITSGLLIQPGDWNTYSEQEQLSLDPDFQTTPFVRLILCEMLTEDLCILLHGFTNSIQYEGEASSFIPGESERPENGQFLGPANMPWATPIILLGTTDFEKGMMDEIKRIEEHIQFLEENGTS